MRRSVVHTFDNLATAEANEDPHDASAGRLVLLLAVLVANRDVVGAGHLAEQSKGLGHCDCTCGVKRA
jgi:hypothetical protein